MINGKLFQLSVFLEATFPSGHFVKDQPFKVAITTSVEVLIPDGTIPHAHLGTPHFQSHLQLLRHRQNPKQQPFLCHTATFVTRLFS